MNTSAYASTARYYYDKDILLQSCFEAKKNGIYLKSNHYLYKVSIYEWDVFQTGSATELECILYSRLDKQISHRSYRWPMMVDVVGS